MAYDDLLVGSGDQPERVERAYQQAAKAGKQEEFAAALEAAYGDAPDNLLYAAWHFRLRYAGAAAKRAAVAWGWALPLAFLNGLAIWLLSDDNRFAIRITDPISGYSTDLLPMVALLAAPISAVAVAIFLTGAGRLKPARAVAAIAGLAAAVAYALVVHQTVWPGLFARQYVGLMVMHLALLAWAAVAFVALAHGYAAADRFAFLLKSLEAVVVGGLMAIAGGLFVAITAGLFDALGVQLPEWVARLFIAGGTGLVVVLAVALVYDPRARPADQSFDEGVSRLVALLLRLLLPLAIVVLVVYLGFIPFNFREPFENREVLIAFNAMLFAVVALLVGATPISGAELPAGTQRWLRRGVIALAVLALAVGVYALAAIIYRTATDRLTPNRFAFIGWNVINIGVLAALLAGQWRVRAGNRASIPERTNAAPFSTGGPALPLPGWIAALQGVFAGAMVPYLVWTVAVILVTPWIFHGAPPGYADLPESVRRIVYEQPDPILLKCPLSPHVYLFKDGHKLWIKDIPTFESEGFRWDDVELVPCSDLWKVPDGNPIPAGAGSPPLP